jgi:hypothetical protein
VSDETPEQVTRPHTASNVVPWLMLLAGFLLAYVIWVLCRWAPPEALAPSLQPVRVVGESELARVRAGRSRKPSRRLGRTCHQDHPTPHTTGTSRERRR